MLKHLMFQADATKLGRIEGGHKRESVQYTSNITELVTSLKECSKRRDLEQGKLLHIHAFESGLHTNKYVSNALIAMYSKCRCIHHAQRVFDDTIHRNVVSWTSLIMGYMENGEGLVAIELFESMDCEPDSVIFVVAIKACMSLATKKEYQTQVSFDTKCKSIIPFPLKKATAVHMRIKECGLEKYMFVATTLVEMYCKFGNMEQAQRIFDNMEERNVVSWNVLVLGYVENGQSSVAIEFMARMDCEPSVVTFLAALRACSKLACLETGMAIHKQAKEIGYDTDLFVGNNLVDMYSKCGCMCYARDVFDDMVYRDSVSWNILILGYVEKGKCSVAMELFGGMDCEPDSFTFVALLKACTGLAGETHDSQLLLETRMAIHREAVRRGLSTDLFVVNNLVEMYTKCGSTRDALVAFEGMELLSEKPDSVTFTMALKACTSLESHSCLEKGMAIHRCAREFGLESDVYVATSLVDMYSKCGSMRDAQCVFDGMLYRGVVSWNSLIHGYVENGESHAAIELFVGMDCDPDSLTFVYVIKGCGSLAALVTGQGIHAQICRLGLEQEEAVGTSLVDFYGKCGHLAGAEHMFNKMQSIDIVLFSALLAGYSSLGDTYQVFSIVRTIQDSDLYVDGVTFVAILTACSHAGMVDEGLKYFGCMSKYCITPTLEHYTCIVSMLGKVNRLQEALSTIYSMAFEPDSYIWTSLLVACRNWNNMEVGKVAFDALVCCDAKDGVAYVLISDMCKKLGVEGECKGVKGHKGARKKAGQTWWCTRASDN